ncbi:MAG: hypothetical protein AAGA25_13795, partial [Planctomycetota bacterium]
MIKRPRPQWTCWVALLLLPTLLVIPACEQAAVLAEAVRGPEKVDPLYILPDAPTLVMVDDPKPTYTGEKRY